jgi:hypothetical protein
MEAGFAWTPAAEAVVVYTDRGISAGMHRGIAVAKDVDVPVEYRQLSEALLPTSE